MRVILCVPAIFLNFYSLNLNGRAFSVGKIQSFLSKNTGFLLYTFRIRFSNLAGNQFFKFLKDQILKEEDV